MLIFIHGFNSAGNGDKAKRLRSEFTDIKVLTPTCPFAPEAAITMLSELIGQALHQGDKPVIAGSSLGGFYAAHLAHRFELASVLINPLIDQTLLRHETGPQTNYYTGEQYEWSLDHCARLDRMVIAPAALAFQPLLLLDEADELLDSHLAISHYGDLAETHLFPGGSHRFDHMDEAIPLMRNYIARHS
ncbi:hypothetical protein FEF65_02685 [Mariprofundus erugo]|uniref:Esterase n=1 Tax=Mariprofundus erugo TaxID=2528639 RepID=A0A5R9GUW7_9PROT|nr:YqiA/YcfP family alpha/beta fold hydrolase [Mariprofundus erugo]TLS68629.1 hypothetical protein FEF65_02685 [Mariprofundus erugo]